MRQQRPETPAVQQAGNRRVVTWLVAVEGDAPLKLAVTSQKGGTQARTWSSSDSRSMNDAHTQTSQRAAGARRDAARRQSSGRARSARRRRLQTSPAGNHGELDFPINWKQYYSYAEKTKILQGLQKQYSQLSDLSSIGKSRMGRDQWMLTITAKGTGPADSKPAMWVDGAIHGNEINGVTCSLYLAWYLLTRYDYDPYVKDLVDHRTFYILPGLNVDGNDSYATEPNTENNPREPYRPEDNDGDGLYDEDQTEDVDGDGEISMMWAEDPAGTFKLSPDKRRFVPVTEATIRRPASGASAWKASTTTATAESTRTTSAGPIRTGTSRSAGICRTGGRIRCRRTRRGTCSSSS